MVEITLYIAILSTLLFAIISIIFLTYQYDFSNDQIIIIDRNAQVIEDQLRSSVIDAQSITSPSLTQSSSMVVLQSQNLSSNPTTIELIANDLVITKGTSTAEQINSNRVLVSNVIFTHIGTPERSGLQYQFSLASEQVDSSIANAYSSTYQGIIWLRI